MKRQNLLKFYLVETCLFRTRTSVGLLFMNPQKRRTRSYQELSTFNGSGNHSNILLYVGWICPQQNLYKA